MAATGNGVAISLDYTLLIYDGEGNLVASVDKSRPPPEPPGYISWPVAGQDGSLYFTDAANVYRVDAAGRPAWAKPFGPNQSQGSEFGKSTGQLLLDGSNRLYASAPDGKLWIFRGEDGQVLSSIPLGLRDDMSLRTVDVGVGKILVIDRKGIAAAGPDIWSHGFFSTDSGGWLGEVTVGQGTYPPYVFAGYDIGFVVAGAVVVNPGVEITSASVVDRCGRFRWQVPGNNAVPLAITFDDDLIVMDRVPAGPGSAGSYTFSLRRFSRDGALVAGPVPVADQFCGRFFVGADDTFYYTTWSSTQNTLKAFDSSLRELWSIPFPRCPDAAVL